jgi:hypothetical protein
MTNAKSKRAFHQALVRIDFDRSESPQLHCPVTKAVLLPAVTPDGIFFDGVELEGDFKIDFHDVKTVLFFFSLAQEEHYLRSDLEIKVQQARETLGKDGEELTDLQVVEDHVEHLSDAALVFHVVWGGDQWSSCYVGLDLNAVSRN